MTDRPIEGAAGVVLDDSRQIDISAELARIHLAHAEGRGGGGNAAEMEALRRPYRDDPWPWIMVVITVVIVSATSLACFQSLQSS
jgi:hypothetical protein